MVETYKKTHQSVTGEGSLFKNYQDTIVGTRSIIFLFYFELCLLLGKIPGAVGLILRKFLWPYLFCSCGKGVVFGSDIILRHPRRIHLGNRVVISEGCILDARNSGSKKVILIADDVMIANYTTIQCKGGYFTIGPRSHIGIQTVIQSADNCSVDVGANVRIGTQCYIIAGKRFNTDPSGISFLVQEDSLDNRVILEDNVDIGPKVVIFGGAKLEKGSFAAPGAIRGGNVY